MKLARSICLPQIASGLTSLEAIRIGLNCGARSLGRTPGCDTGTAWVFFADGFYEVQPSDGDLSAVGIWRDGVRPSHIP